MKKLLVTFCLTFVGISNPIMASNCPALLDHRVQKLNSSEQVDLCALTRDRVVLVVNTASHCAFTPQYEGLESLHKEYQDKGLVVLGFPSNDFGKQEPGSGQKIADFCRINYGVTFPMFSKIKVKGEQAHPLYKGLADAADSTPRWNFHKYLIGRDGNVVDYFASWTGPTSGKLRRAIEREL